MQSQNRMLDDLVKMLNGAAGTVAGMGREAEGGLRERMREWVGGMDMVSREEFDAVKAMARGGARPETCSKPHRRARGRCRKASQAKAGQGPQPATELR